MCHRGQAGGEAILSAGQHRLCCLCCFGAEPRWFCTFYFVFSWETETSSTIPLGSAGSFLFKLGDDRRGLWHPKFCTNCDLSPPKQNKLLFLHFSFCIIISPEGKLCMLPSCCTALMQAWNTLLFECAPSFPNYGSFLRFEVKFFLDYLKLGVKFLVCSLDCLCALKRSVQECCILNTLSTA